MASFNIATSQSPPVESGLSVRSRHASRARANAIVAVGVRLDQAEVVLDADHRPRVAGQRDDRQRSEDCINRAPLKPEIAEMRARQHPARCAKQDRRRWPPVERRLIWCGRLADRLVSKLAGFEQRVVECFSIGGG